MGILLSQARLAQINSYRSDLEYKIQLISSTKLDLSAQINKLVEVGAELTPNSPEMKALEKRQERLHMVEKTLDQQLQNYQTQLKFIEQESQSVKANLDQSINRSFSS